MQTKTQTQTQSKRQIQNELNQKQTKVKRGNRVKLKRKWTNMRDVVDED